MAGRSSYGYVHQCSMVGLGWSRAPYHCLLARSDFCLTSLFCNSGYNRLVQLYSLVPTHGTEWFGMLCQSTYRRSFGNVLGTCTNQLYRIEDKSFACSFSVLFFLLFVAISWATLIQTAVNPVEGGIAINIGDMYVCCACVC